MRVNGGEYFRAPTERAIELSAGSHRVVFEHPDRGRVEFTIELDPGEERTVSHRFRAQ